jgi:small-conductance mechanosensitive channel
VLALEGMIVFLAALALLAGVLALRRSAAARRLVPDSRILVEELRAPQLFLTAYVLVRLALFWIREPGPALLHGLDFAAHFCGGVGLLRTADVALFALLRARGRQGPPRIVRSLINWLLTFLIAAVTTRIEYQADLSNLFATSALLSVVLGFALQESLGNLFAGLTLNAERPFDSGDWVSFGKWTGRILDVGWRSTRLITLDEDEVLVPNGLISREVVVNHSRPSARDCVELNVRLDLDTSPARAKQVLLDTVRGRRGVLDEPKPTAEIAQFHEDGVDYRLRFHTPDYGNERAVLDEVQQALWYALRRAAIELPYRQQTLSVRERPADSEERRRKEHLAEAEDLLSRIDFVAALKPEARQKLAAHARFLEYGPGEAVVRQGDPGDTFYLVARGEFAVRVRLEGGEKEVARLSRGHFFGEMSLLTGEPRTATVVAAGDAALLGVDRDAFSRVFTADEGVFEELARIIAGRKAQLASARAEGVAAQVASPEQHTLLARIRGIFGLRKS